MFYRNDVEIGFIFSDVVLTKEQWVFSLMEHLQRFILSIVILIGSKDFRIALTVFVCIEFIEILDFILTWGEPWFESKIFTWNTIKVGIFGTAILFERRKW